MKLIDSKAELVQQPTGIDGMYKTIELIGRVCIRSEDKITDSSAEKFVENMKKLNHVAVLEHGTIYLTIPNKIDNKPNDDTSNIWSFFYDNPYSYCTGDSDNIYITTNFRVIFEGGPYRMRYLKYMTPPTKNHMKRITIRFTLSRAIANEFVRRRHFSFMQESTRYVNYKEGVEFIKPEWWDNIEDQTVKDNFAKSLKDAENSYKYFIIAGLKPQEARDLLPLATKTTLYMTGTVDQWKHFFSLRSPKYGAQGVHPDAAKLADEVYELIKDELTNETLENVSILR